MQTIPEKSDKNSKSFKQKDLKRLSISSKGDKDKDDSKSDKGSVKSGKSKKSVKKSKTKKKDLEPIAEENE